MTVQIRQADGYQSFAGGQNEGISESLIPETQTRRNINVSLIRNAISPRDKIIECELDFLGRADDKPFTGAQTYAQIYKTGRVQHFGKYISSFGRFFVSIINGVIFVIDPKNKCVRVLDVSGQIRTANPYCYRIDGTQAYSNRYVIFDWPNQPIIIEGLEARRADASVLEIPKSYTGAFVHGRLHVANTGIEFGSSDVVGSDPNNADPLLNPPISFAESIVDSDINPSPAFPDGFYALSYIEPLTEITAMGYLLQQSSSGFGPLWIGTCESISLFPVNQPRANWDNSTFGQVVVFQVGPAGFNAAINVKNDLYFFAKDCQLYSLGLATGDQNRITSSKLSREVEDTLRTCNKSLVKYSSLGYWCDRIFVTAKPCLAKTYDNFGKPQEQVVFSALAVMELDNRSGLTTNGSPIWAGSWDINAMFMEELDDDFYIFGRDCNNEFNALYEVTKGACYDHYQGLNRPVHSRIYTREFTWSAIDRFKHMEYLWLNFRRIIGDLKGTVWFRTSSDCKWEKYGSFEKCGECCERGDLNCDFMCKPECSLENFKQIQFKIDIIGNDYELVNLIAYASIHTELSKDREHDTEKTIGESQGDFELCV